MKPASSIPPSLTSDYEAKMACGHLLYREGEGRKSRLLSAQEIETVGQEILKNTCLITCALDNPATLRIMDLG